MSNIVTRFSPGPTGYLHVGEARTGLFNRLHARHMKSRFVLRIEDTDIKCFTQASVNAIFEVLEWLGKKQVISRLQNAARFIKAKKD